MQEIRLGVVDDHEVVRYGVAYSIAQDDGAGELPRIVMAADGPDVDALLGPEGDDAQGDECGGAAGAAGGASGPAGFSCDVVLLDMFLGDGTDPGHNVTRLRAAGAEVVVFSVADDPVAVRAALRAGAVGVVPKTAPATAMTDAVRRAAAGLEVGTALWAPALAADLPFTSAGLSPRECEALELYATGLPMRAVAVRMGVAETTVKEMLRRIRDKYRRAERPAPTKIDLRQRAVEDGLLPRTPARRGRS